MTSRSHATLVAPNDHRPLVPVLPARGKIDPALDRIVSDIARFQDVQEPHLRNTLYVAYLPRLRRILLRLWYHNLNEFGCELDDLEQELFLIFQSVLNRWSGSGSLSAYLHGAVPWRLYDAARRLAPRDRPMGDRPATATTLEASQSDAELALLLEELAHRLSPFDRDLFFWHVRDGKPLAAFANMRGMSPRTIRRAWLRLQHHLRRELAP